MALWHFPEALETRVNDMRCVVAVREGTVDGLVGEFRLSGHDVTREAVHARGEAMIEMWRVGDLPHCYLCGKQNGEKSLLCSCYNVVRVKRYYDTNNAELLASLPASAVVETYACKDCGVLCTVRAQLAQQVLRTKGTYRSPRFCMRCFDHRRAEAAHERELRGAARPAQADGEKGLFAKIGDIIQGRA